MEEEFKVVKRKRKKGKPRQAVNGEQTGACTVADVERVIARLDACKRELEESCFWLKFKETVTRSLEASSRSYKDEAQKGCNLQADLSPLTLNNHVTNKFEECENLSNHYDEEAGNDTNKASNAPNKADNDHNITDNDTNIADNSTSKIQQDEEAISRGDERLEEARLETSDNDHVFSVDSIVCYGLGNFSSCVNAKYQLALLLLLVGYLEVAPSRCFCYDPVFTNTEHDILKGFGLSCLEFNEEGKRPVNKPTIFYMPHCGKPLYNNLLWSNWPSSLTNLIIIGNSFRNFDERFSSKLLEEEVPFIKAILPFTHQLDIVNNFKFLDIFNDIGIHVFLSSSLQKAPSTMWTSAKEPNYSHLTDVEIITKQL